MPVNEGVEGAYSAPPQEPPVEPVRVTPTLPPGYAGPTLPQPMGGIRGLQRFQAEHNMMAKLKPGTPEYRTWILSLKEDPTDPEYSRLLRDAQAQAQKATLTAASGATGDQTSGQISGDSGQAAFPTGAGLTTRKASKAGAGKEPEGSTELDKVLADQGLPTDEDQIKQQKDWRRAVDNYKTPVFRGRPVGSDDLYAPEGTGDPTLDQWLSENGVKLDANSRHRALKSGQYVYMGTEVNNELGGVTRDVYLHVGEAAAASQQIESGVIAKYQSELGLTVTGRMDPYLQPIWEEAVKFAQDSARTGKKISVREWFDIFVSAAISQKKGKGGGGGGGSADMEEFDYYRAMMQVLGDISGVGGG